MPMQILRTPTVNNLPTALVEGQLAIEMASTPPRLWCGVPPAINVDGRKLINPQATMAGGTAPGSPVAGDLWFDTTVNILKVYNGTAWEAVAAPGTVVDVTAPANPEQGLLWWDPTDGTLWIWYTDPTSSQWVEVTGGGGGGTPGLFTATGDGIVPASGGGTSKFLRADATWHEAGGPAMGVTDGSDAAPGQIGEYLRVSDSVEQWAQDYFQVALTLPVTPGDWDIVAGVEFPSAANLTAMIQLNVAGIMVAGDYENSSKMYGAANAAGILQTLNCGPVRLSTNANQNVFLMINGLGPGLTVRKRWIRARRMR
jgi:hypothetical protein